MTTTFNFDPDGITLDETQGRQFFNSSDNTAGATDDDDNDTARTSLPTAFANRLFVDLGLPTTFPDLVGVAVGNLADPVSTTPITAVSFDFINGTSSGLFDLDGNVLFLYADPLNANIVFLREGTGNTPNPAGAISAAIYLVSDADGTSTTANVDVWIVQFEALDNGNNLDHDNTLTLGSLSLKVTSGLDFNFAGAPSGQNYFMAFGDVGGAQLLVSGKNPILDTTGGQITAGDTVNTSKGGGPTTLGTNNQMITPGEGLHFRFVTGQNPDFLVPNLSGTEADVEANIQFTGFVNTSGASVTIVQTQPGGGAKSFATVKLSAFVAEGNAASQSGTNFAEEINDDTPVNILTAQVIRNGAPTTAGITFDFTGDTLIITGIKAGDTIAYITDGVHNHVLVENAGNKNTASFDIGGFAIQVAGSESAPIQNIFFDDDGPTAAIADAGGRVRIDETAGLQNGAPPTDPDRGAGANPNNNDVLGSALLNGVMLTTVFASVTPPLGPDFGMPQYALSTTALVNSAGSNGGADGIASTVFSLAVTPADGDSGLATTAGKAIKLFLEGDLIVGRYDVASGLLGDVTSADPAAFAIAIGQDGNVAIKQFVSLKHLIPGNFDEPVNLTGKVSAVVTVTDRDGDVATNGTDIGDQIFFEDDGPLLSGVDSSVNSLVFAAGTTATDAYSFSVGADNEGAPGVQLVGFTDPDNAADLAASGLGALEALLGDITAVKSGNTVTYYTPDGPDADTDPDKLFELTVDNAGWSFEIFQETPIVFSKIDFSKFVSGGPVETITVQSNTGTTAVFDGWLFSGGDGRAITNPQNPGLASTADDLNPDNAGFGIRGLQASNINNNEGFGITFFGPAGIIPETVAGLQFKINQQGNTDDVAIAFQLSKGALGGGNDPTAITVLGADGQTTFGGTRPGSTEGEFFVYTTLPKGNADLIFSILPDSMAGTYVKQSNEIVVFVNGEFDTSLFKMTYPQDLNPINFTATPFENDSIRIKDVALVELAPSPDLTLSFLVNGTDGDGDMTPNVGFDVFISDDGAMV